MLTAMNSGDTAWMLIATVLVFLMVPGLAIFYGGLTRKEELPRIFTVFWTVASLVILQWIFFGYSLAFGPDHNGWIGTLSWAGLRGVGTEPNLQYAGTTPHFAFVIYQGMIAVLTPAIFIGAFSRRITFGSLCLFTILWTTLVYDPIAHWVWAVGGFLRTSGMLDFSGGAVVHLNAAISALAISLVLGKSDDDLSAELRSSAPPLVFLGATILWFGWFGLAGGSALSAGAAASSALVATLIAGS